MKKCIPFVLLAACAAPLPPAPVGTPVPVAVEDTCHARKQIALVGQDSTALEKVLILGPIRLLRPGTIVTQDYRPERVNIHLDDADKIVQFTCGRSRQQKLEEAPDNAHWVGAITRGIRGALLCNTQ